MPTPAPVQFTTADKTLVGPVNGTEYSFTPDPVTLLYAIPPVVTSELVFLNGQLTIQDQDYTTEPGWISFVPTTLNNVITALLFQSTPPGRQRLSQGGIVANGTRSLRIPVTSFILFRNGQLLTSFGADYSASGVWVTLSAGAAVQPGDEYLAFTAMNGTQCSTFNGSITGTVNGTNAVFTLPSTPTWLMLFRNGQYLTQGRDFTWSGNKVILQAVEIPQSGDILTAELFTSPPPVVVTNVNGTLFYATAVESILYRNGLFMTQPVDCITAGNTAELAAAQMQLEGDVITLRAWTVNVSDPCPLPLNLPQQFSTSDGSIIGVLNGANNIFTLACTIVVAQIMLMYNGLFMTPGNDYNWTCTQANAGGPWTTTITMAAGNNPQSYDVLTAEVFFQ